MSGRTDIAALRAFSVSLCRAAGLSADDAALFTDSIVFAECRGVTSHGLLRLPQRRGLFDIVFYRQTRSHGGGERRAQGADGGIYGLV